MSTVKYAVQQICQTTSFIFTVIYLKEIPLKNQPATKIKMSTNTKRLTDLGGQFL